MNVKQRLPLIAVTVTSILCIAISIFSLKSGWFIVFQNFFYIPIIVACYYYKKQGFAISVTLSCIYFILIIAFTSDPMIIRDAVIRVILFILIAAVITALSIARARAEEALQASSELFSLFIRHSPIYTYIKEVTPTQSLVLQASDNFGQMIGIPGSEMAGKTMTELFPPELAAKITGDDWAVVSGGDVLRLDEELNGRSYTTIKFPIVQGDKTLLAGYTIDITERKRAEDKLHESEQRYRLLIETASEGIFVAQGASLKFVNPMVLELTGLTEEELISLPFLELVHHDDRELARNNYLKRLKGEAVDPRYPLRILKNDKSIIWIEMSGVKIEWEGHPATLNFVTDITERKQAEEEKRSLEERLQRSEKMESLGTLAGGVAHDLNNVLGLVVGYAELLLMDVDESSPIRPSLVTIMDGGQRAAAIVHDLLTLARRGVPSRNVLNLNNIIADCQKTPEFEKLSSYHPFVKIKTDLEPDLLNISGSSVHLGKTLFNLVSNASEAMTKGGIVTIKTANQYLDKPIHGYDEVLGGDYVVLSVTDTGEGISAADLKRIFEPFYTKKVMGRSGTGLGLAVVWGTVKDHNGYINVESVEEKGSTFTLYFPVTREDISAEAAAISISEYIGKGESILVVDDVKGQRNLAATMLQKLNYRVASVPSGEEAIEYLKDQTFDLIILDMIMDPGIDGLDTYRSILEIHPRQKAIIVSGFSETDRVITAQALGAGAYVRKPYVIEKLGLAVKKELDRK